MSLNPLPLLKGAFSAATGFLGGIQTYLIVGAVSAAVAGAGGAWAAHHWDQGTINAMKLADAQELTDAVTKAMAAQGRADAVNLASAQTEDKVQAQIVYVTRTLHDEVDHHVPITYACIPVGLVRLLNGAAAGSSDPDTSFAPGQPDDACAKVSWRSLGADLIDDYGTGNANAEQLDQLETTIVKLHDAYKASDR